MRKNIIIKTSTLLRKISKHCAITFAFNILLVAAAYSQTKYYSRFSNTVAAAHATTHPDQITIPIINLTVALGTFTTPENITDVDTTNFSHYANTASVISNIGLLSVLLPGLSIYAQGDIYLGSNTIAGTSLAAGSIAGFVIDNQPGLINISVGNPLTLSTYLNGVLQESSTNPQTTSVPSISATAQDVHFTTTKPFNQVRASLNGSLLAANINLDPTKGTNFYFAYGISSIAILPVTLTSFIATPQQGSIKLSWVTASETKNTGFAIERSADGTNNFSQIDFIASKATDGNSNTTLLYSAVDASPLNGINYYRLKQVDFDGTAIYSSIQSATSSASTVVYNIFPNPATSFINIQVPLAGNYLVELFSIDGKKLQATPLSTGSNLLAFTIDKANVPNGIYSLKVTRTNNNKAASTYYSVLIK